MRVGAPRRPPRAWRAIPAVLTCIILIVCARAAHARNASGNDKAARDAQAWVVVDGRKLFRVAGVPAAPASERAERFADRIRALASQPPEATPPFTIVEAPHVSEIQAGGAVIVRLFDADARLEGLERPVLAAAIEHRLTRAIDQYREERSTPYLRRAAIRATVSALVLAGVLIAFRYLLRWAVAKLQRRSTQKLQGLRISKTQILPVNELGQAIRRTSNAVWWLLAMVGLLVYVNLVLTRLPWTRGPALGALDLLIHPLELMGRSTVKALPGLAFCLVLFLIVRYVLRAVRLFFAGVGSGALTLKNFDADWAMPTYSLVRFGLVAIALVAAFPYIPGSSSQAFKGMSIFIGVLVSLGSSSHLTNTFAGYMLRYRRAFRIGDRIRVGEFMGDVIDLRLQETHIRTFKNEEIILPNSSIMAREVVNYSSIARGEALILHTTVGIGYETPWRQVEAMLLLAASRTEGLLRKPEPFVWQTGLGDFCITYELNAYYQGTEEFGQVYTAMHRNILDVFNEYGIQIMTPAYERDPEQPKVVPREHWHDPPAPPSQSSDGEC